MELSEHEVQLVVSVLELWLDEYGWAASEPAKYAKLYSEYAEKEQLARKLGWKPRSEDD